MSFLARECCSRLTWVSRIYYLGISFMKNQTKTYSPCHNKVILRVVKADDQLLHIPDSAKSPGGKFLVEDKGPLVNCCDLDDTVVLHPNANILGLDESQSLVLVDDTAILAIER